MSPVPDRDRIKQRRPGWRQQLWPARPMDDTDQPDPGGYPDGYTLADSCP